ncbi:MAG: FG-GAP repeat protein, partial [Planctomycetota bacterium]
MSYPFVARTPIILSAISLIISGPSRATLPPTKLMASDGAASDQFGRSVDIDGNWAIIGSYLDDDNGDASGSAYIFHWDGSAWVEEAKLFPSDPAASDQFGYSVSISGDTVTVGTNFGTGTGAAYVFTRSGSVWTEQQKLFASDGIANDRFGKVVSIDGDTAVVCAPRALGTGATNDGAVYVFTRTGTVWAEQDKLLASDGAASHDFAESVSLDADSVLVGAPNHNEEHGASYIFVRAGSSWSEQAKIIPADIAQFDQFGGSVAIDGDTAVIGSHGDDDDGSASGSAYVYTRSGTSWSQQDKLTASDAEAGDLFGYSVAIEGDTAAIGVYGDDIWATDQGSVYVFDRSGTTWSQTATLTDFDGKVNDRLSVSVALSGDRAIAGAWFDDDTAGANQGSAVILTRVEGDWLWFREGQPALAPDGNANARFGHAVAIDGKTAIIGAPGDDENGSGAGAAYIFINNGGIWEQQAKLIGSDTTFADTFGCSVSIDGDTVAIGAKLYDGLAGVDQGAVYVFTRAGSIWTEQQKLIASDASAADQLGYSVALSGETLIAGAPYTGNDDGFGGNWVTGAAYAFVRSGATWAEQQRIDVPQPWYDYESFGSVVSLDGDVAAIGAPHWGGLYEYGAAYMFRR